MLRPYQYAESLSAISPDELTSAGICGIILDLDNTIVPYGGEELAEADRAWIALVRERGFRIVLLSNNFADRVGRIADALGIPAIPSALKPLPTAFYRALRRLGTSPRQTIVIGDQLFTDVLGAKLFGMRAILTTPIVARDHGTTRLLRMVERWVIGRRERIG